MAQQSIKAIETVYNGYRFRSRLEARWAVFFDAMGFPWEYEKEGYNLVHPYLPEPDCNVGTYLPDFWLPQVQMWAEVKPEPLTELERLKCWTLALMTDSPCLMLVGIPSEKPYWAMMPMFEHGGDVEMDYALSNHCDYPKKERRFFVNIGFDEKDSCWLNCFGDMRIGVNAARQARFEHGEHGR